MTAVRALRLIGRGWLVHTRLLSGSGYFVLTSSVQPVIYASIAFYLLRAGDRPDALPAAAIGAGMLGVWHTTLVGSGQALTMQRLGGVLELLVVAPVPAMLVFAPITLASATVGMCAVVATLAWGRLLYDIPIEIAHPWLLAAAVPATVLSLGMLGVVLASMFVRFRYANALTNVLVGPVWLACGLLVPVSLLPGWLRPLSWVLPPTWAARAVRDSMLGGRPLPALGACLALAAAYMCVGLLTLRRFEQLARRHATLALS